MPLTTDQLNEIRDWCRLSSTADDAAIQIAYDGAVEELETHTGWTLAAVTRTQFVYSSAALWRGRYLLLDRQPAASATVSVSGSTVSIPLVAIRGLRYGDFGDSTLGGVVYPCVVTVVTDPSLGIPSLCKTLVYERVAHLVASRGDEVAPMDSSYWLRGIAAIGRGID